MSKATTIKDAIKRWEEKHPDEHINQAEEVGFQFQWPPIEKMDNALSALSNCKKLSLSTNMIEKITGIGALKKLKILVLSRNNIKTFAGLEPLGETLEQLWMSYNIVERTKGIGAMKNLKVLYIGNNVIKDWGEFNRFQDLPHLVELLFVGNPLFENTDETVFRTEAAKRLPHLKNLDGVPIIRDED